MRIDDNAEALAMMKRALGSLESKFREAYNKGFHDGRKDGINQAKIEIANKILGDEEPCIDIETGILHWCGWEWKRIEDEPQTDEEYINNLPWTEVGRCLKRCKT